MTHKNTLERRRLAGLCRCGEKPADGKKTCSKCIGKVVRKTRTRMVCRKVQGLCRCGKPPKPGIKYCEECAAKHVKEVNAIQRRNRSAGLCLCGQSPVEGKDSCERCLNRRKALTQRHKANGICVSCQCRKPQAGRAVCDECAAKNRAKGLEIRARYRKAVMSHYGNMCACCGETHDEFLTIDHMDNDGSKHREEVDGARLYRWLMKNNYPKNFQILCYNCNIAKGRYGKCPHCLDRIEALLL